MQCNHNFSWPVSQIRFGCLCRAGRKALQLLSKTLMWCQNEQDKLLNINKTTNAMFILWKAFDRYQTESDEKMTVVDKNLDETNDFLYNKVYVVDDICTSESTSITLEVCCRPGEIWG